ncbi:unnamed protein product [Bursaphelenchus xylophilus]|uniref:(pine wood nematode) hypothetical protein n=1 Tax=Bursaphelenchus xylophilus TaxID=6326 RepID=A0A1I7SUA4_BURXY|nr:unnamed protein product [Bursaphelenchus xylophilus]CAG9107377.1 unnamed protein product [Bursaphelenchus xylophilus]
MGVFFRTRIPGLLIFAYYISLLSSADPTKDRIRLRRQFNGHGPQIDLNITVPYIFSARLYPYGQSKGDHITQLDPQPIDLHTPLKLFGRNYETLLIHKDGYLSLSPSSNFFPTDNERPVIALFWMPSKGGRVYFRETTETSILSLVQNEVNIQYRYGKEFKPSSVLIVTWEGTFSVADERTEGNIFQVAIVLSNQGTFAHFVYSRLVSNNNAAAGFSGSPFTEAHFYLPGSGTPTSSHLVEKSNIGIPGEWLFRIDDSQIYLCGAGFKGLECVDSCSPNQWYLDCSRECHCHSGVACNTETGVCPNNQCSPGWTNAPRCDEDVDECLDSLHICPEEQPDCVNTAGSYLCLCFEYDNTTNSCRSKQSGNRIPTEKIPVSVMPLVPQIAQKATPKQSIKSRDSLTTSFSVDSFGPSMTSVSQLQTIAPIFAQTDHPLTIQPVLGTRARSPSSSTTLITPPPAPICPQCDQNGHCEGNECVCNTGWTGNGIECIDLNECAQDGICGANALCQNTLGSYQCVCDVGFVATGQGCVDLDECSEGLVTCRGGVTARCVNKPGGFECQCAPGYTGSPEGPQGCQDINECDTPELYCGNKAKCKNNPGSYSCECFEGYEKAHNSTTCVDINECLLSPCDSSAVCTNLDGTFQCKCVDGFVGNGIECRETILFPTGRQTSALPQTDNAVMPYRLEQPLKVFGKEFEVVFISANGLVSFDRAFSEPVLNPESLRSIVFYPLHDSYKSKPESSVTFKEITESDATNYGLLSRASLLVQNKFNMLRFHANRLLVVTYEKLSVLNSFNQNTFQLVIAQSNDASFVIYLYENVDEDSNSAIVGFSYPNGMVSVPAKTIAKTSNVGQKGKWIWKIDNPHRIENCPAGKREPPFCEDDCTPGRWGFSCEKKCKCADGMPCDFGSGFCANGKCASGFEGPSCGNDIDECQREIHNCHVDAVCTNTYGSFTCKCRPLFAGDGVSVCKEIDECFKRFNKSCAPHSRCDTTNPDYPECVCIDRYHGDGRRLCQPDLTTTTPLSTLPTTTTVVPKIIVPKESEEDIPFNMRTWTSVESKAEVTQPIKTTEATTTKKIPQRPKVDVAKDYDDTDNDITVGSKLEDTIETSSILFLIVPGVVVGVWLVLVMVVLVQCCRRRRNVRLTKYSPQMMSYGQHGANTTSSYFGPNLN